MNFNLDLMLPYKEDVVAAVEGVVRSQQYIFGQRVKDFEGAFAGYTGQSHCVGVGSGTDALRIAMLALGIRPGDEVISPAFNVSYAALAVAAVGAKNVFVDCDPRTMLLDPTKIAASITGRTRMVIPVHLFGQMCDMEKIRETADAYGLLVLEDAAQCHGAARGGHSPGKYAHAVAYSFYPTKNLGALGEGGAITTNIPIVDERARLLRDGGRTDRYLHNLVGINSGLDEIQAAVLSVKLPHLDHRNSLRRIAASRYEALPPVVNLPAQAATNEHVYHLYVVRVMFGLRDALREHLTACGIPTLVHYPVPVPYQPCFVESGFPGPWPEAESAARRVLSLPMHPDITADEQDEVVAAVWEFYERT